MISQEEQKRLKEKLEAKQKELEKEIKELEKTPDFGNDVDHGEEESDEAEELGTNLGIAKVMHERLHKIKEALAKMEQNKYGKCEKCGKDIEMEILNIDPESSLCRICKEAQ